jgi:hypothetical protein
MAAASDIGAVASGGTKAAGARRSMAAPTSPSRLGGLIHEYSVAA